MTFGPSSLGVRSILGDPRSAMMPKTMNLHIEFRESFRPFAPAMLREDAADWFELNRDSPCMLPARSSARSPSRDHLDHHRQASSGNHHGCGTVRRWPDSARTDQVS